MKSSQGAAPERSAGATLQALARNVELVKVMMASGVHMVAKMVVLMLVLPQLKAQVWSKDMAEFQSMVTLGLSITAIVTSSHFGRFSDTVGRRAAAAVFGVCSFAPAWSVLAFGLNERGLYASCVGSVISGIGVQSNVLLLLASDVTDPADREVAFGAFPCVGLLLQFLLLGVPSLLIVTFDVFSSNPMALMVYQAALSVLYFLILASIRVPAKAEADSKEPVAQATRTRCCASPSDAAAALVSPLRLCGQRSVCALALCSFLMAFAGDLLMDIGSQFFRETLGLIPYGTQRQHQLVNVMSFLPSQLLVLPGYVLVGLAAKRLGSLRLLLLLIPLSAVLQSMGAALLFVREVWFVGAVTVANAYGNLLNVPLQYLVTVYAPEDRHGEVMGMMGACQQVANMLGNLAVILVTPLLRKSGLDNPLWVYYPLAGLIVLLAIVPACSLGAVGDGTGCDSAEAKKEGIAVEDLEEPSQQEQIAAGKERAEDVAGERLW